MDTSPSAPVDLRSSIQTERQELLGLLRALSPDEWRLPTPAARWRVQDVALHLLDDDLGWLSRRRDRDMSGFIDPDVPYRDFVRALDEKNQRWVDGARGLSQRVVSDLLEWSGEQVTAFYDDSPEEISAVGWAGGEIPPWLPLGRDFTERWVHQQQIREAVHQPGGHARYLPSVLAVFVWAFPHQVDAAASPGTTVAVTLGEGRWHLARAEDRWQLREGAPGDATAGIEMDADTAWRQLTGAPPAAGAVRTNGPAQLVESLLGVRGIIV